MYRVSVSVAFVTFDTRIMRSCVGFRSLLRQNNYDTSKIETHIVFDMRSRSILLKNNFIL